ncbi:hypothetical protein TKK_0008763 [Trichogramma kaykai]|uniref:PX domain-containing protein n=1 Tax=Trichogramma kaykai TaxID=54128 RepID=A0ABD2X2U1_9HYME
MLNCWPLGQKYEMYHLFISGYRLVNVPHGKPYHVYTIEILNSNNGARYLIEKRYSEFSSLHRMLKKECDPAPFPPKRVRNSNPKVLEHRRAALEIYMQKMLRYSNTKHHVLNFLGMSGQSPDLYQKGMHQLCKNDLNFRSDFPTHPVLTFLCDPYIHADKSSSLPDIVTNGVLLGIYKS